MKQNKKTIWKWPNGNKKWIMSGDYARKNLSTMFFDDESISSIYPRIKTTEHGSCIWFSYHNF